MKYLFLIAPLLVTSCVQTPVVPVATKTESPSPIKTVDAFGKRQKLLAIVAGDACSKESYKQQGSPPPGYNKGLALTYAKIICEPNSDGFKVGSQPLGDPGKDALAWYGLNPKTPTDRLNATFALMIGSNARESSWRPCVGRDIVAKESDVKDCLNDGKTYFGTGKTCEAGLAQTSYNSVPTSGPLRDLFNSFMEYPKGCFREEYYGATTCSPANWKNHGSDPKAIAFQKMSKECPGFTVESGVQMFRTKRTHYGPLNTKAAELKSSCVARFEKIRQAIVADPDICLSL